MTISSTIVRVGPLVGDAANFTFDFSPLVIYSSADLEVYHVVTATGVETLVTEGTGSTNYSLNMPSTWPGTPGTGTLTYPADSGTPIPTTEAMVIKLSLNLVQSTDFKNQGGYFPEVQERRHDKALQMIQDLQEQIDRCLKIPITDAVITNTEINTDKVRSAGHLVQVSSDGITFVTAAGASSTDADASNATPADVSVSAGASGSSADFSRDDHVHLLPTTVPRLATENIFTETQIWAKGADVTAAGTLDLDASVGNFFDVTGNTAITAIGTIGIGTLVFIQFDGTPVLTHHTTNLILPGGVDILMQAGDIVGLYEYASADWRLLFHTHGTATNGRMPGPDFESAETALNDDAQTTFAHGLASIPNKVEVVLRANTATSQGWADNEEMVFPSQWQGALADDAVDVTFDATNVYITQGFAIQLLDHTSFNSESITQTQYDWVVRAWQ